MVGPDAEQLPAGGDTRRVDTPGQDHEAPVLLGPPRGRPVRFDVAVWTCLAVLVAFCVVGLGCAVAGWFRPLPVILGTVALSVLLVAWIDPRSLARDAGRRTPWALTLAVLVVAVGSGLWNAANHGEHLIAERDPGVYTASALWLADTGTIRVERPGGAFADAPGLAASPIGFSPNDAGSLDPQFPHLNAVFLATGSWFGTTRMFMVPALLMAAALVLVYALGMRFGRPWGGAFGALGLAVSYPMVYVARDTYSEPLALVLLLAGLWALTFVGRHGARAGVLAGALLGATCMARIDGFIPLIPVAGVIALDLTGALRTGQRRRAVGDGAAFATMVVFAGLGAWETWALSRSYFDSNLAGRLPTMVAGIVAATLGGAAVARLGYTARAGRLDPRPVLRAGFAVLVVGVVAFLVWARWVRPDFTDLRVAMDQGLSTVALLPWAKTLPYLWLEWYLGPVLVALAFAALLWMTGRGLLGRDRRWLATAGVGFATTLLYLVSPSITPDQPWAMRRFMAVSIPIMLLAAGMALEQLARRRPPWTTAAAVVVAAVVLVPSVRVTHRLSDTAIGRSLATRFGEVCRIADQEPSAILVTSGQMLGRTVPVSLAGLCGVPVAGAGPGITADQIESLAAAWRDQGRQLLLLTTSVDGLAGVSGPTVGFPGPALVRPEGSIDHAPSTMEPDTRVAQSPTGEVPLFVVAVP